MIPMALGFFKPHTACIEWTDPLDTVPSMTVYGFPETGTPSVSSNRLQIISKSATANTHPYSAYQLDDSQAIADFQLSWSQRVDATVSSGVQITGGIAYRSPAPSGVGSPPYDVSEFTFLLNIVEDGSVVLYRNGVSIATTSITAGSENDYVLRVIGNSHRLWINTVLSIDVTDSEGLSNAYKPYLWNNSTISASGRINQYWNILQESSGCFT